MLNLFTGTKLLISCKYFAKLPIPFSKYYKYTGDQSRRYVYLEPIGIYDTW